jgi:hypothetical protein
MATSIHRLSFQIAYHVDFNILVQPARQNIHYISTRKRRSILPPARIIREKNQSCPTVFFPAAWDILMELQIQSSLPIPMTNPGIAGTYSADKKLGVKFAGMQAEISILARKTANN